jgi:TPR repeat protein
VILTGICFVAFFIWLGSKPESTPTTNNSPATVTSVPAPKVADISEFLNTPYDGSNGYINPVAPAQSVPQATTPQDIFQQAENLHNQGRYAEALPLYQGLAEQGNTVAQFRLGVMYEYGRGVAEDEAQAIVWFRKAAEQGDAVAQYMLGAMYADGLGVVKDEGQAVYWLRKAAEQGDANAIAALKKLGQ